VKYLLDTNTCIGWLRHSQPNIIVRMKQESVTDIAFCSVVVSELIYGVERAAPSYQANNRSRVEQLRRQFRSIPFDDLAAEQCGQVRAHLATLGTPIGPNDLMIASIALANRLIVVTNNTFEFSRVPGLVFEDWQ
jgi:tRNA(fMet)-specific endonuclease VapC